MRQPNGCSTPAPGSSAAKQWLEQLAQKKKKNWVTGRHVLIFAVWHNGEELEQQANNFIVCIAGNGFSFAELEM